MDSSPQQLRAQLGFNRPENAGPDEEHAGLLRGRTLGSDIALDEAFDFQSCILNDCLHPQTEVAGLEEAGFEAVDLSAIPALQASLRTIRDQDGVSAAAAAALRESLQGARIDIAGDRWLRVEHVADEGLIHRHAGPNALDVNPGGIDGANGHDGARGIHADQDVFGTPLRQMMNGEAPEMFRHRTHDARNDSSSLFLLNLWIPIRQITRPLVLMDRRTLDAKRHQLRYGLPVTRFLDREESRRTNDIWTFLHDPGQAWYFRSEMGPDQAYLFDTLGEPHGATILPGEDSLEQLYLRLGAACDAIAGGEADDLRAITAGPPPQLSKTTTLPIRHAWREMTELLAEAKPRAEELCRSGGAWALRAKAAMERVVRKSVEMRLVATLR